MYVYVCVVSGGGVKGGLCVGVRTCARVCVQAQMSGALEMELTDGCKSTNMVLGTDLRISKRDSALNH